MDVRYLPLGDTGLTVEFGNEISPAINSRVTRLCDMLKTLNVNGIIETMPTYRSVSIYYDPAVLYLESLTSLIDELLEAEIGLSVTNPYVIEIPVWYSPECGPDLEFVAQHNGKTVEEVIAIHSAPEYLIYQSRVTDRQKSGTILAERKITGVNTHAQLSDHHRFRLRPACLQAAGNGRYHRFSHR